MFGVGGEGREHMSVVSLLCKGIIAPVTDKKGYKFAILSEYLVPCLILRKLIVAICYPRSGILDWTFDIWHPKIDVRQPTSEIRNPTSNIWHPTSAIQNQRFEIRHPISNILDWTYCFFLRSILAARAGDLLLLELSAPFSQDPPLKLQKRSILDTAKVDTHATMSSLASSFRMLLPRVWSLGAYGTCVTYAGNSEREKTFPTFHH